MKLLVVSVLCLFSVAGCSGPSTVPEPSPSNSLYTDYAAQLPFVEEVQMSDTVTEGQPSALTVRVSSFLHPETLRANNHAWAPTMPKWGPSGVFLGVQVYLYLFELDNPEGAGPIVDQYSIQLPELPAGDYKLYIDSAESREWGGLAARFQMTPELGPLPAEHVKTLEIPFTVQPEG